MTAEWISILVLAGLFVLATVRNVHLGAAALAAAWVVGTVVFGLPAADIAAGFPTDLFVTLVGVTLLFAVAEKAGAVGAMVYGAVRLVGGRVSAMPWVVFVITAIIAGVGAATPAAAAIVGPLAMGMAKKYGIHPVLMGMAVIQGASAGSFGPIGMYGMIINGIVGTSGLPVSPNLLFAASFVFILLTVVACFFRFGGLSLYRRDVADHAEGVSHGGEMERPVFDKDLIASLVAIVVLAVLAFVYHQHIGFAALTLTIVLGSAFPSLVKGSVKKIAWPTTLLVTGTVTYIGLLQNQGVVDWLANSVAAIGVPLLAALVILLIAAVVSALASTTGILAALVPLAVPFLLTGDLWVAGVIAALAISASVVDCSPFSTNGALMIAYTEEPRREAAYKSFFNWGWALVVIGPVVSWLLLVVAPTLVR
ncbi:MAG: hypothetical protein LBB54_00805 [Cellulomonadaceae bacterium]|nr:hypothetical protein [Cellulomonadaceae bacterium]